jgi:hypothetical protein
MAPKESKPLLPGTLVEVRSWPEIRATLDEHGMLDQLPFMREMAQFCGKRLRVSKRLERTCEETYGGMRRIRPTVFLENLRCDGSAHGGCQKGCRLFWKDAWLRRVDQPAASPAPAAENPDPYPYEHQLSDGQYICQATELIRATTYLPPWDFGMYIRDIRSRTYSVTGLIKVLAYAWYLRLRQVVTGKSYRVWKGELKKTPGGVLNLQPGEWVKVKTPEEIASTLDQDGKNRGLAFTVEMLPFCGRTFRVLRRLEKMIHDPTRKLIKMDGTVILEDVTCDGCHILRGGCPRDNYQFWREIWLERVPGGS